MRWIVWMVTLWQNDFLPFQLIIIIVFKPTLPKSFLRIPPCYLCACTSSIVALPLDERYGGLGNDFVSPLERMPNLPLSSRL